MFFAPWCAHCASFQSTYDELSAASAASTASTTPFAIAKVDATHEQSKDLTKEHQITSFPTLMFFSEHGTSTFKGATTFDAIMRFVDRKSVPAISILRSMDDVNNFFAAGEIHVIGNINFATSMYENLATTYESDELINKKSVYFATVEKYSLLKDAWKVLRATNSTHPNYYDLLELPILSPTAKEIKKNFRVLSKALHPDKNPSPAAALHYNRVSEAFNVLSDKTLRQAYDESLSLNQANEKLAKVHHFLENLDLFFCLDCFRMYNSEKGKISDVVAIKSNGRKGKNRDKQIELMKKEIVGFAADDIVEYEGGMIGSLQASSAIKKYVLIIEKKYKMEDTVGPLISNILLQKRYKNSIQHIYVNPVTEDNVLARYSIPKDSTQYPIFLLMNGSGEYGSLLTKVLEKDDVNSPSDLAQFYDDCLLGPHSQTTSNDCAAKPRAGSEKALSIYNKKVDGVRKLVGKTFNSKILKDNANKTDVVVMFYNQHDTNLQAASEFEQVAKRLHFEPSLEFYKIDVSLNDVPNQGIEIKSTPCVYMFRGGHHHEQHKRRWGWKKKNTSAHRNIVRLESSEFDATNLILWMKKNVATSFVSWMDGTLYEGHGSGRLFRRFAFWAKGLFVKREAEESWS